MTKDPIALYEAAAAQADRLIAGIRPGQLDDPSPCAQWRVRDVINHLVSGNKRFTAIVAGSPPPEAGQDHLGDDPLGAFRASIEQLSAAFAEHDVLSRTYDTPIGKGPGALLVKLRMDELVVHGWDLAKATGQSTDLDHELVAEARALFEAAPVVPRGEGKPFGETKAVPPDATDADRLAAFLGRDV
jgi:uncharacterized protein (TIGR03086 family)